MVQNERNDLSLGLITWDLLSHTCSSSTAEGTGKSGMCPRHMPNSLSSAWAWKLALMSAQLLASLACKNRGLSCQPARKGSIQNYEQSCAFETWSRPLQPAEERGSAKSCWKFVHAVVEIFRFCLRCKSWEQYVSESCLSVLGVQCSGVSLESSDVANICRHLWSR